jgi:DNA-binding NarL/FixJ family response regulator
LREAIGAPLNAHEQAERDNLLPRLRAGSTSSQFAALWEAGRSLSRDEAVAEALAVMPPAAAPAGAPPPAAPASELTPREREVLALLVEGQSDREIGEALYISPRTVSKHVAAILAKLGVATRTAAATAAHRAGFL